MHRVVFPVAAVVLTAGVEREVRAVPDAAKVSAASSCGSGSTTVNRVALAAESGYLGR